MAPADGRDPADLIPALARAGYRFDFFQAVRLLTLHQRPDGRPDEEGLHDAPGEGLGVGRDLHPGREPVRFRALPSLGFPTGAISEVRGRGPEPEAGAPGEAAPPEMVVSFLGLTGPNGTLPRHYTELLIQRIREKDFALRDFLDLFNHRLVSLFYRAWEKYRWPVGYERARLEPPPGSVDPVTDAVYGLDGLGTRGLRGRLDVDDEAFLYYSGHYSHFPRSAIGLESLLGEYLDMPVQVLQCQGQWLALEPEDQALMPSARLPAGRNNQLGVNLVVGERVWDVQSKFRIRVGPLTWRQFRALMPNGPALRPICQMARLYAGPALDLDVQPLLKIEEVPRCRLSADPEDGPYLGWNTWTPFPEAPSLPAVQDAVFQIDSI